MKLLIEFDDKTIQAIDAIRRDISKKNFEHFGQGKVTSRAKAVRMAILAMADEIDVV